MISVFHGNDAQTHDAFQTWRRAHVDGFHMTESEPGRFIIHYTQDRRENPDGRGCIHQGGSDNDYREDKGSCYTVARKVCSDSLAELMGWVGEHGYTATSCKHCDTKRFPFPTAT
jgi:hypothetical protein